MDINWYPGHMAKTQRMLADSIKQVDCIAELLDARIPRASRNPQLEELAPHKPRLILLNRIDLADPAQTKEWEQFYKEQGCQVLLLDCKSGQGCQRFAGAVRTLLSDKIAQRAARGQIGHPLRVMVVGVPNVGKSSFINRIAGRTSAKVENRPGVTRGKQWVTAGEGVELLDTPGILWPKLSDQRGALLLAATGAIRDQILDEETLAVNLLPILQRLYPDALRDRYRIDDTQLDGVALLEAIARKRGLLAGGGYADTERAAPLVLSEFRTGKLGCLTLECLDDLTSQEEASAHVDA